VESFLQSKKLKKRFGSYSFFHFCHLTINVHSVCPSQKGDEETEKEKT